MERFFKWFIIIAVVALSGLYVYNAYEDIGYVRNYQGEEEILFLKGNVSSNKPKWSIVADRDGKFLKHEVIILEEPERLKNMKKQPTGIIMVKGEFVGEETHYNGLDYVGLGENNPFRVFEATSFTGFSSIKLEIYSAMLRKK